MTEGTRTATAADWLEAARPHTWANAFAPVLAGTAAAMLGGGARPGRAVLAGIVAWALIIGVNYANDYSDGIRGTDDDRSGPLRITGSGLVAPGRVKAAAFAAFGVAAVAGCALAALAAWWLIPLGAVCILAAWFYTGGRRPYGYRGLGEAAVFVFFGLVAVCGTEFVQAGRVSRAGLVAAVAVGAISASVNLANNLRDIPSDAAAGKRTLAVALGDAGTRRLWPVLAAAPLAAAPVLAALGTWWALACLAVAPALARAARPVLRGAGGAALIPVLGGVGRAMLAWSALLLAAAVLHRAIPLPA